MSSSQPVARLRAANLSRIGLVAQTYELANLDYCNVDLAAMIIEQTATSSSASRRGSTATRRAAPASTLELARELADRVGLPLMVHIGAGPPALDEVVP